MAGWTRSLRWRFLGLTLLTLAAALAGAGWSLAQLFREHASAQFEAQLRVQLDQLTAAFEPDGGRAARLKSPLSDPRWQTPYSGLYWQIEALDPQTTAAATVLRSRSLWDFELQLPRDQLQPQERHSHRLGGPAGQPLRALERRVQFAGLGQSWRLVVAADETALDAAVAAFSGQLVLFLFILAAALLLAAWLQVSLGLRPLRALQASLKAVRQGQAQRLQGGYPLEVEPLVQDFNRVLDQSEQVVARARQLAGNLAHAIKTPLAVMANLAEDDSIDRATLARQLREQVANVRQQVDWHLHRSRSSRAGLPGLQAAVQPVLEGLVRVMRKVHAHREDRPELSVELEPVPAGLCFAGEEQDLQEMVGNLLDNGCKWARSRVRVRARVEQGLLIIAIDDDGPGLSAEQRQAVFERGVRADERMPGSGLGLAIVRESAALYQGSVALQPSGLGGLRAELRLAAVTES
jgi:signal transduction histidine kinase